MNTLMKALKALEITADLSIDELFQKCTELVQKTFVPQKTVGIERPCEEKDFREYRLIVDRNLQNIRCMLQHILHIHNKGDAQIDCESSIVSNFTLNLLILIGEHHEKNIWNTAESVHISKELATSICNLYNAENISQFFVSNNSFNTMLLTLRSKLLKDTWKTYPSAIACFKWILKHVEKNVLLDNFSNLLPTMLLLIDDYVPENVVIGLECLHQLLEHTQRKHIDCYGEVIYHALERLMHQQEAKYIVPLYSCLSSLITQIEYADNNYNVFEWTKRDDVLAILLDNMEFEQNLELRCAYMTSLPQFLTNVGCVKWGERLTRIISDYCVYHTDLRTLKATLQTAKAFLLMFHARGPTHCVELYTAFLKLHFDLTETPVLDKEIVRNLEDCMCLLYKSSPNLGQAVIRDDRMRFVIESNLRAACLGDTKYFE